MNRRGPLFPRQKEQKPQTVRFYEEGQHFTERKAGRREKTNADVLEGGRVPGSFARQERSFQNKRKEGGG